MRFLLDTRSFLWFIDGSASLSLTARALIENADNQPLLSMAECVGNGYQVEHRQTELGPTV